MDKENNVEKNMWAREIKTELLPSSFYSVLLANSTETALLE
jgi:hypothetical protein